MRAVNKKTSVAARALTRLPRGHKQSYEDLLMSRMSVSDRRWFLKAYGMAHEYMDCYYRHLQKLMLLGEESEHSLGRAGQVLRGCLEDCRCINQQTASVLKQYGDSQGIAFGSYHDYQCLLQDQIHSYGFLKVQHQRMQRLVACVDINMGFIWFFQDKLQAAMALAQKVETSLEALEKVFLNTPRSFEALIQHCKRWGSRDEESQHV